MIQVRIRHSVLPTSALIAAIIGAVSAPLTAVLAENVNLGPLLFLHAPVVLISLMVHASSLILAGCLGAATYGMYAEAITAPRSRSLRFLAACAVVAVHVGCLLVVSFAAPMFGL